MILLFSRKDILIEAQSDDQDQEIKQYWNQQEPKINICHQEKLLLVRKLEEKSYYTCFLLMLDNQNIFYYPKLLAFYMQF